ncbi:MAG: hypothetical protein B7733_14395 [Myxococcales bacterium FL481]|nr:MAG: hypothetical protein B7733_14395 [Myxococcales bacterium FL481]
MSITSLVPKKPPGFCGHLGVAVGRATTVNGGPDRPWDPPWCTSARPWPVETVLREGPDLPVVAADNGSGARAIVGHLDPLQRDALSPPWWRTARRRCALGLVAALLGLGGRAESRASAAKPIATMPVDEVRPGMKGTAYTVFSGTEPEPFAIEIIDVIPAYLPRQDLILFRALDPRLEHSGIVAGMSGSPIYIGDKLLGALAYGWRSNKDPIGGITPIANMLEIDKLPYRPEVVPGAVSRRARHGSAAWADEILGLGRSPLPPRQRANERPEAVGLEPLGVPLSVGGLGPAATGYISEALGLQPARGGGGQARRRPDNAGPAAKTWRPGDSVSVVLASGDSSVAPNGTVTWVGGATGQRMLAFGHPMSSLGPTNLPIADAQVHVIIPSRSRSIKLSSPRQVRGTMIQDRQPAIALRTSITAPTIPVMTTVVSGERRLDSRSYNHRIASSAAVTPDVLATLLIDALDEAAPDGVACTAVVQHDLAVTTSRGPRTVRLREETFFPRGIVPAAVARHRAIVLLGALMDNDLEIAQVRGVSQRATVQYGTPVERIEEVRLTSGEVRPGELVELAIVLRKPLGGTRTQAVKLRIPSDAADETVVVEVVGGDGARPYRPRPKTLDDLIDTIETTYPERSIVATVYRESEGLSTPQGLLSDLPDSVLETLTTRGATSKDIRFKNMSRRVIATPTLIAGKHRLKLDVLERRLID